MKNVFWSIALLLLFHNSYAQTRTITQCLIDRGIASNNCTSVGYGSTSLCFADLQKHIARSVSGEDLAEWITQKPCWGMNPTPAANATVNCNPPYDQCWSHYCPAKYCDIIKMFVDLKASLITRAVNPWGKTGELRPGTNYYNSIGQIVVDINAAYDCAGLFRPIIQAGIFEDCDASVSSVQIPASVLLAYRNDASGVFSKYFNPDGSPKVVNFSQANIISNVTSLTTCPDITKFEARLWFYYLATLYIDLGYKSIHLGQWDYWGRADRLNNNCWYTIDLLKKIRNYAASKGTFILLTEENFKAFKEPGTDKFMFDYDSRALRIREAYYAPFFCGDNNCLQQIPNYNIGTPCATEQFPGLIDPCVVGSGGNLGGISPLNNCYIPYMPYNTYFDFGPGIWPPVNQPSSGCTNPGNTWGYDDTRWFAEKISKNCRKFWMEDAICRVSSFLPNFSFMSAPCLLPISKPDQFNNHLNNVLPTASGSYLMSDEPDLVQGIIQKWAPNYNISMNVSKACVGPSFVCQLIRLARAYSNKYTFTVANPDCNTIYTFHIKNPDGSWQPYTYGNTREFIPPVTGTYKVYIRQDNLGFSGAPYFGSKTNEYSIFLFKMCCGADNMKITDPRNTPDYEGEGIVFEETRDFSDYEGYIKNKLYYYESKDSETQFATLEKQDIKPTETLASSVSQRAFDITIHPNPAQRIVYIRSTGILDADISVSDVSGRELIQKKGVDLSTEYALELPDFADGLYFLKVFDHVSNKIELFKLMKK